MKPTIELKNIRVLTSMSQETNCYEATLYVNGVKWGVVGNEGHGGPDHFYGINGKGYDDIKALDKQIAETYPKWEGFEGQMLDTDLEILCGELVGDHLLLQQAKRLTNGKIAFLDEGEIYTIKFGKNTFARLAEHVKTKYPNARILNDLSAAEIAQVMKDNT